jgi:Tol biopolymer transport system component
MKISTLKAFLLLPIIFVITFYFGCKNDSPVEPDYSEMFSAPAALENNIPYNALGRGKIVFSRTGPDGNYSAAYIINVDSEKSSLVLDGLVQEPSISPDGKQIAFRTLTSSYSLQGGTYWDIYVVDSDGNNKTQVSSFEWNVERPPSWSQDGNIIYAVYNMEDFNSSVYKQKPAAGTTPAYICDVSFDISSKISVLQNNKLLYSTYTDTAIFVKDLSNNYTGSIRIIYKSAIGRLFGLYSPQWSPGGSEIACMVVENDTTIDCPYSKIALIKMNADGSNQAAIVSFGINVHTIYEGSDPFSLCWSPDGKRILFSKPESDLCSHIYVINSDGSGLTQVTTLPGASDGSVSWSL